MKNLPSIKPQDFTELVKESYQPFIEGFQSQFDLAEKVLSAHQEDPENADLYHEAGIVRKAIKKQRSSLEKARKEIKEPYLQATKLIDGEAKAIKDHALEVENDLQEIEEYQIRKQQQAEAELESERREAIEAIGSDPLQFPALGKMEESVFESVLLGIKAKQEAEREEAERLKREQEESEKARQAELKRAQMIADRTRQLAQVGCTDPYKPVEKMKDDEFSSYLAKKTAEHQEAQAKAKAEAQRLAELEAKAKAEKAEAEKARQEAERIKNASDAEKLEAYLNNLLSIDQPAMSSAKGQKAMETITARLMEIQQKALQYVKG